MELNSNGIRKYRGIRGIVSGVILTLAGLLFVGLGIFFLIKPLTNEDGSVNHGVDFAFIGLGAVAAIAGIITIIVAVKALKRSKPLSEEEVKENIQKLEKTSPKSDNLVNTKLFFHFGGTLNQSFLVENKEGKVIYNCKLKRFNPFGANVFDFIDVNNNYTKTLKIGKTLSSSTDGGIPFAGDTLSSRFKIDGINCWDYLYQRGYDIKVNIFVKNLVRYDLVRLGKVVASIVPCSIKDPFNEDARNILRMGKGVYRLEIIDARLEDVVMAAFIVAQTDMVE